MPELGILDFLLCILQRFSRQEASKIVAEQCVRITNMFKNVAIFTGKMPEQGYINNCSIWAMESEKTRQIYFTAIHSNYCYMRSIDNYGDDEFDDTSTNNHTKCTINMIIIFTMTIVIIDIVI